MEHAELNGRIDVLAAAAPVATISPIGRSLGSFAAFAVAPASESTDRYPINTLRVSSPPGMNVVNME